MEQQEVELLRQRVAFLEEMVERCLEQVRALESRMAMIEGRPAVAPPLPLTDEKVTDLAREVSEILRRGGQRRGVE
jgi:hypothetical protein